MITLLFSLQIHRTSFRFRKTSLLAPQFLTLNATDLDEAIMARLRILLEPGQKGNIREVSIDLQHWIHLMIGELDYESTRALRKFALRRLGLGLLLRIRIPLRVSNTENVPYSAEAGYFVAKISGCKMLIPVWTVCSFPKTGAGEGGRASSDLNLYLLIANRLSVGGLSAEPPSV
ncbi:hypothetical protein NFI96_029831 [Prochilodus magdalenae]|nr:hypothetical protein NFI96_029831 [Prochilodus magdalenae]